MNHFDFWARLWCAFCLGWSGRIGFAEWIQRRFRRKYSRDIKRTAIATFPVALLEPNGYPSVAYLRSLSQEEAQSLIMACYERICAEDAR